MTILKSTYSTNCVMLALICLLSNTGYSKSVLKAENKCELYSSVTKQEDIGDVKTVIGKEYMVVDTAGVNYPDYVHVKIDNEYPEDRWVHKSCGSISAKDTFTPFFVEDGKNEGQAMFPTTTKFDELALKKCGDWGSAIVKEDLDILFSGKVLQHLYVNLDKSVITKNADIDAFKKELVTVWLQNTAFEHVICGEPTGSHVLGGLHYVGRYLDLQKNHWGGLNDSCAAQEIRDPVYTIGVDFLNSYGDMTVKCPSGYNWNMNVIDILLEGTKAFKEASKNHSTEKFACTYTNENNFHFTFVAKEGAITTFYPTVNEQKEPCQ